MSRRPSPTLAAAARKFSYVLREAAPKAANVDAGVEPPTIRSCVPQVSSTIDTNTRPMSERINCTLTVSAQLMRSDVSSSRQPIIDTLDLPEASMIRSASPRRRRTVVYQSAGTSSLLIKASGAIGAASSAVASGRPFGVASCPAARSSS